MHEKGIKILSKSFGLSASIKVVTIAQILKRKISILPKNNKLKSIEAVKPNIKKARLPSILFSERKLNLCLPNLLPNTGAKPSPHPRKLMDVSAPGE